VADLYQDADAYAPSIAPVRDAVVRTVVAARAAQESTDRVPGDKLSRSESSRERIEQMVESLRQREFPGVSVSVFDSADAPLSRALIRVRSGSGRIYTVAIESDITEEQVRNFIQFALSN